SISGNDVVRAIRSQSTEAGIGQIGQPPVGAGQLHQLPIDALGRLSEPEQFAQIVVKTGQRAQQVSPSAGTLPPRAVQGQTSLDAAAGSGAAPGSSRATASSGGPPSAMAQPTASSTESPMTTSFAAPGTSAVGGATTAGGATSVGGASLANSLAGATSDTSSLTSASISANEAAAMAPTPGEFTPLSSGIA